MSATSLIFLVQTLTRWSDLKHLTLSVFPIYTNEKRSDIRIQEGDGEGEMDRMYDADVYLDARPTYPRDWYSMLASRTPCHSLAWDAGTGNGQAAIGVCN